MLDSLKQKYERPDFWNNQNESEKVIKEINKLNDLLKPLIKIKENVELLLQFKEFSSDDSNIQKEIEVLYNDTFNMLKKEETLIYLSSEFDNNNSIFEIHAGAGGTESCDWALMLSRMYTKYFDKKGYSYEIIDEQFGEETGIKSIVYLVKGALCYGYLKSEKGVHRLVRLSPFDSNNRRHTSFASVEVTPIIDNNVDVEINEKD